MFFVFLYKGSNYVHIESGKLVTTAQLDREATPELQLGVTCHMIDDKGLEVFNISRQMVVEVLDENDNAPRLQSRDLHVVHLYLNEQGISKVRKT